MKIVIAGAGKIGSAITRILSAEGHDIVVIDQDPNVIRYISDEVDVNCLEGMATIPDTLLTAGIDHADLVVAVTEKDEVNMVCSITAKKLGARYAVARIRDPEYNKSTEFLRTTLGIDISVNPELECAREISRMLSFPGAVRVDAFSAGNVEIVEYRVPEGSRLDNTALKDLPTQFHAKILVCVVERNEEAYIPNGSFILKAGDRLSITGDGNELRKFFQALGAYIKPVRSVLLMGGGRIAVYLARILAQRSINVTIIEQNKDRCELLCELVPQVKVICGDATQSDVLQEENISETDAFVALTGDDGDNIITSMFVKNLSDCKIITKINRTHFSDLLENSGLDSIVTPKDIVAQQITRYVRALNNSIGGSMETLHRVADGQVEAMEFRVDKDAACIGIPLKNLKLRKGVLLTSIVRNNKSMLPGGESVIQANDMIVVVSRTGQIMGLDAIIEGSR